MEDWCPKGQEQVIWCQQAQFLHAQRKNNKHQPQRVGVRYRNNVSKEMAQVLNLVDTQETLAAISLLLLSLLSSQKSVSFKILKFSPIMQISSHGKYPVNSRLQNKTKIVSPVYLWMTPTRQRQQKWNLHHLLLSHLRDKFKGEKSL